MRLIFTSSFMPPLLRQRRRFFAGFLLALATSLLVPVEPATSGGAGTTLPPFPLPVRQTEFRIAQQIPMVCVNDPGTACVAPYLDASSNSTNTDGGTFRSTSCPGAPTPGACRPDYVPGAEITGEFLVSWPITRTPPDPDPGIDTSFSCSGGSYKFCYQGNLRLNATAPGVAVTNPLTELDYPGECDCFSDVADEQTFAGFLIDDHWVPRNKGATCDLALEYATLLPRDEIRMIGQQAFPALLCEADGMGECTLEAEPVLVEPDGSLTKGCGDAPSNTFTIRFVLANEPLVFEKKPLPGVPTAVADVNGDDKVDLITNNRSEVQINDGSNGFTTQSTGLASGTVIIADLGDWTNDGNVDLVTGPNVTVYPGDGLGGFDGLSSFVISAMSTSGLSLRDLNGDSRLDAVSVLGASTNVIWNQTGAPISPAVDTRSILTRGLADLDGGGTLDLLSTSGEWAANAGPGSFAISSLVTVPVGAADVASLIGQEVADAIGCALPASTCCVENENFDPGCDDSVCESAVCAIDSNCCTSAWDDLCAETAITTAACSSCFDPNVPDCCGASSCSAASCEDVVCALDSLCCGGSWGSECAAVAGNWCGECQGYRVVCDVNRNDVGAADVEGDGDVDLVFVVTIDQALLGGSVNEDASMTYLTWLPNLQVDDPVASGGNPLFDPAIETWRPIGPTLSGPSGGPIELVDLDADSDPDLVGVAFWYRNDGGSFAGPFGLDGVGPDLDTSPSSARTTLFVRDMDDDGEQDVVTFDAIYVPEPGLPVLLSLGIGGLWLLGRCRAPR